MNNNVLQKISYGMYILTSKNEDKVNGQIANALLQMTSDPVTFGVCVNNNYLIHEFINKSKVFTVSILSENAPMNLYMKEHCKSFKFFHSLLFAAP